MFTSSPGVSVSTLSPAETGAADVTVVDAEGRVVETASNSSTVFRLSILYGPMVPLFRAILKLIVPSFVVTGILKCSTKYTIILPLLLRKNTKSTFVRYRLKTETSQKKKKKNSKPACHQPVSNKF